MADELDLRDDFPMLKQTMHGKPLVYFDSAATSQKPSSVIECMNHFYQNDYATVHRAIYDISVNATHAYEEARLKAADFLGTSKREEIIFTRGVTEGINLVASSFGKKFLHQGDEVLITEMEHHSNIVPWQLACEASGAILKVAPIDDHGILIWESFLKLLTPKTKIVAVTHISNALGTINPIKLIIEEAHKVGAKVLVDAAQSAPHIKINVKDLDVDFLVVAGHKLYGPTGIGLLYGKEELLNEMPPYQGGGDMIESVTFEKTTYNALPLKFEAGTPLVVQAIGLGAAIDYIQNIGLERIEAHEQALRHKLEKGMLMIPGLRIIGESPQKGALTTFVVEGVHPLDLGTLLDLKGIAIRTGHHCAQPVLKHFSLPATARVSFGLYNKSEEVDYFLTSLKDCLCALK